MMGKTASIIVPVFQAEAFLPELIQSLRNQRLAEIECLLVDDGSRDKSAFICEEALLQDSRICCVRQMNFGVSRARNVGIKLANGEFLLFSDADDLPDEQWASSLVRCAQKTKAHLAIGGFVREQGMKRIVKPPPAIGMMKEHDKIVEQLVLPMCVWGYALHGRRLPPVYGSACRSAYQKCFLWQNGIVFPEGVVLGEDLLFNLKVFLSITSVAFSAECHYFYRENPTSATHQVDVLKRWERYLFLWKRAHQMLENSDVGLERLRWHNYQLGRYLISTLLETICPMKEYFEVKVSLWKKLLQDDDWGMASKALPQELEWRKRLSCMILKPFFARWTLFLYQWNLSRKGA